jgi:hypothetical protein
MGLIISAPIINDQLASARRYMAALRNSDGTLMFKNGLDNAIIVQSTLRSSALLDNSKTTFRLSVLTSDGVAVSPLDKRLDSTDVFAVSEIGIFIQTAEKKLYNYDSIELAAPNSALSNSVRYLYDNGYLSFTNNQQVITPSWDAKRHYKAPITQYGRSYSYSEADNQAPTIKQEVDSTEGCTDGFYPCVPMWIFNGIGNIQINMNIPDALNGIGNQQLSVFWRGFLLQNASRIN